LNLDPRNIAKLAVPAKDYYVGVDLGQKRDYTVVAVVEKKNRHITLKHLKRFPLGTEYDAILEYLKTVDQEFRTVRGFYIDRTGVGEVFVENTVKHGLKNVKGVVLTMPEKQEHMTCLKQTMLEKRLHLPKDPELENEMNGEISEITSTGKTRFYHRSGSHDDRLWAVALAVYGARHDIEPYHGAVVIGSKKDILGRYIKNSWTSWVDKLRSETIQDKYDQALTQTNLSARILRKDPRAILGIELPPIKSLPEDKTTVPKRMCPVCGGFYVFEPGKDSPCGHVKKDGTVVP
jgi:hypothetical protein